MNIKMEILSYDIIKTKNNKLYVLEINSGVATSIFSRVVEHGKEFFSEKYPIARFAFGNRSCPGSATAEYHFVSGGRYGLRGFGVSREFGDRLS